MPKSKPNPHTYYQTLHVIPNADPEVIDAAAKALLRKHHPDHGGNADLCARINEARTVLADADQREAYNAQLREGLDNVIGNYKVIRKISEGGFGRVFEGAHTQLGTRVCIKQNINVSPEDTELFMKEALAIWDLRHHALPAVRDMYFLPDGSCALVMSFIEGPTLQQIVEHYAAKKKLIDPENVCWITERVLDGLRYMHYHGVTHGDVKPQNIIVQPKQHTAALVDFGLCNIKPNDKSRAEGFTRLFASPEHFNGGPIVPESDLYCLGLTMIYALGGDVQRRKVPASTPAGVRDFLSNLVVRDITQRPHWENTDLVQELRKVREKEYGRAHTDFKELEYS